MAGQRNYLLPTTARRAATPIRSRRRQIAQSGAAACQIRTSRERLLPHLESRRTLPLLFGSLLGAPAGTARFRADHISLHARMRMTVSQFGQAQKLIDSFQPVSPSFNTDRPWLAWSACIVTSTFSIAEKRLEHRWRAASRRPQSRILTDFRVRANRQHSYPAIR